MRLVNLTVDIQRESIADDPCSDISGSFDRCRATPFGIVSKTNHSPFPDVRNNPECVQLLEMATDLISISLENSLLWALVCFTTMTVWVFANIVAYEYSPPKLRLGKFPSEKCWDRSLLRIGSSLERIQGSDRSMAHFSPCAGLRQGSVLVTVSRGKSKRSGPWLRKIACLSAVWAQVACLEWPLNRIRTGRPELT